MTFVPPKPPEPLLELGTEHLVVSPAAAAEVVVPPEPRRSERPVQANPPADWAAWAAHSGVRPRTSGWAVSGFILAFLVFPLGFLFSLIALVEIGRSGGMLQGRAYAISGLVISFLFFSWITLPG